MASSHGHIGEFNNQLEDLRLQNYFVANDIKNLCLHNLLKCLLTMAK